MLAFLENLVSFVVGLVDFFINIIKSLIYAITLVPIGMTFSSSLVLMLPAVIQACVLAGIALTVLFLILGRHS